MSELQEGLVQLEYCSKYTEYSYEALGFTIRVSVIAVDVVKSTSRFPQLASRPSVLFWSTSGRT